MCICTKKTNFKEKYAMKTKHLIKVMAHLIFFLNDIFCFMNTVKKSLTPVHVEYSTAIQRHTKRIVIK